MSDNICSCVVHTRPGNGSAVAGRLAGLSGVEVHAGAAQDKLVVTIEDTPDALAADTLGGAESDTRRHQHGAGLPLRRRRHRGPADRLALAPWGRPGSVPSSISIIQPRVSGPPYTGLLLMLALLRLAH